MAKTPPAAAAAPVLDDPVELPAEGEPRPRWWTRLPRVALRLPKLPLPKIALSKKMLIVLVGGSVGVGGAGAAAYAFWPAEPEWPRTPVAKKPKAKRAKPAASAPALAASQAERVMAAASAAPPDTAASGPEDPMDRLQRRLAETLGSGGHLAPEGPGELRLTARRASEPAPAAAPRPAAAPQEPRTAARSVKPSAIPWSYDGAGGPEAWGRLRPDYAKCASGTRQSPIDIRDGLQVRLDPVQFDYRPSRFGVVDNGHTVQVKVAPGNLIEVMGRRFELQHFHFHRPSEVRIDGRQFEMDVHLVHKDADGKLAVVAIPLERGTAQPVVQAVWNNLPLEKGEEQAAQLALDPLQLLPADRGYYTYMGSITTPPCSEGVLWMVMKTPVPVSEQQIGIFTRLYPMNARPVQSASGRMIKESGAQ
jgi:carbonic anhydrase